MADYLTLAVEHYRKNRRNHRVLFGQPTRSVRLSWHKKLQAFRPGEVFGYERWDGDSYGTQSWSVAVCRAAPGRPATRLPGILPGAEIWLHANGKTQSKRVLAALEQLEADGLSPIQVPARHWRALHNVLQSGESLTSLVEALT
ncbi:MAG: DUF2840 domain-containing protein [Litorimonas sp.]